MKKSKRITGRIILYLSLFLLLIGVCSTAFAQPSTGIYVEYVYAPPNHLADPQTPAEEDLEIQLSVLRVGGAFPLVFAGGKTMLINQFDLRLFNVDYSNWDPVELGEDKVDKLYEITYTLFLLQTLSPKWQLLAIAAPGLATSFEAGVTWDDFRMEAALGAIRVFGERFSLGAGLAYTRDFGDPIPFPFLFVDWKISPKWSAFGLIPVSANITYNLSKRLDLGVIYELNGDLYHGDPDKWDVDNPQLEYTIAVLGPTVQLHITEWLHLKVDGGWAFYHNFQFKDGDTVERSLDLTQNFYVRGGVLFGM